MSSVAILVQGILAITIVVDAVLLIFVYTSKQQGLLRFLFLLHLFGILGWAISILILLRSESILATQYAFAFALILSIAKYYFVLVFPENNLALRWYAYIPLAVGTIALFLSSIPTAYFGHITVIENYYVHIENGRFSSLYSLLVAFFLIAPIFVLLKKYRSSKYRGRVKEQIKYLIFGVSCFFVVGLTTNSILPVFFNIYFFDGVGPSFSLVLAAFIVFTITKHRFLDLGVILQRGFIYTVLLSGIVGFYLIGINIIGAFLRYTTETTFLLSGGITTLVGIFSVPYIDTYLRKKTDAYFFTDRYDYATALYRLSEVINRNIVFDEIMRQAERALQSVFKTDTVIVHSAHAIPMGEWKAPEIAAHNQNSLTIPLQLADSNVGWIHLGEKRSGVPYTREDTALLFTYSHQVAIALEKARLYKQVDDYSRTLEQRVVERTREVLALQENQKQMLLDISHKLQNPLTVVKSELESLRKLIPHDEALMVLEKTTDEISLCIYNVLHLARLSSDQNEAENDKIDLSMLLYELTEYFEVIMREEKIELVRTIASGAYIFGSKEKFSELITNLVSNSVKYMGRRDKTKERRITLTLAKKNDAVTLSVADTGIGIPKEELPKIFDRFYRVSGKSEAQIAGTGLGLAIAKKIVEIYKGTIVAESTPLVGTRITVTLPVQHKAF